MEVDCAGCAACCIDWRPLDRQAHTPIGDTTALDERMNLVPLSSDDIRALVREGYGDVFRPRLWRPSDDQPSVCIDEVELVAIAGKPVFSVGLRQLRKPVAPFGQPSQSLRTCVFLDPSSLQCRIHESPAYPSACATYPGHHLLLAVESECERVEKRWETPKIIDDSVPPDIALPQLGVQALGSTVFLHPDPDRLSGVIERLSSETLSDDDRREFVAVAMSQSPGMPHVDDARYHNARKKLKHTTSWVSATAIEREGATEETSSSVTSLELSHGAPKTPGW